ncbi:F0F1 ATP synthase subunit B [Horticoccus luteus]|uniref:ATP synthase subunit b n=1 Tax=Horticoccus luteus TaxID=2862869 RepID=A0A8F9TVU9_9BACT|nr:F0F1 ATP synthase subunit B [Horticoccus luteus]QYM79017.1 F0F1 ATP synthase subunit B [Horticoccus luteus]
MISPLLILAQAAGHATEAVAAHGEATNGITKITQEFGISWPFLLAQVLSFSIVAIVLWRFAFKPVLATLDERQQKIASGLRYADEMKAKLDAAQTESAALIKTAQLEATRVIDEARKTAKEFLDKQTQETSVRANEMLVKAQQAIELEHKKMLADARLEIARLVVSTTQRVLAKELTDSERSRYNDAAARELASV